MSPFSSKPLLTEFDIHLRLESCEKSVLTLVFLRPMYDIEASCVKTLSIQIKACVNCFKGALDYILSVTTFWKQRLFPDKSKKNEILYLLTRFV